MLIAARVAPLTRHIGLVPTAVVTHTEPFHLSKAIATLDYVSRGRAGVRVQVAGRAPRPRTSAGAASRRVATTTPGAARWSPTCSTRRPTTSRCCAGSGTAGRTTPRSATSPPAGSSTGTSCTTSTSRRRFSVKGPSITPAAAAGPADRRRARPRRACRTRLVARSADVGFVTPPDAARRARDRRRRSGPRRPPGGRERAGARLRRPGRVPRRRRGRRPAPAGTGSTSGRAPSTPATPRSSSARPAQLADLLQEWHAAGLTGFRLRPADAAARPARRSPTALVPELQRRGAVPHRLRGAHPARPLGLPRPANRYASA